jgi:hypothetical protein
MKFAKTKPLTYLLSAIYIFVAWKSYKQERRAQPSTTRDLPKTGPAGESAPREGILRNKATKYLSFQQNVPPDALQNGKKEG